MMNGCAESTAADICASIGGFLPSKDELLLFKNSGYFPDLPLCIPPYYYCNAWTSSEINANTAWALDVVTNTMIAETKNDYDIYVISIGSF